MIFEMVEELLRKAIEKNIIITSVESCTGGLVGAAITSVSGASKIFDAGFITYSNEAKSKILGIDAEIIKKYGAVSKEVAQAMAINGLNKVPLANLSVAITGIAGPNKDDTDKPVGLVYIASYCSLNDSLVVKENFFTGDRDEIRNQSLINAIDLLIYQIDNIQTK